MGAEYIELVFNGKISSSEVEKEIRNQANLDNEVNGHRDGYSGDWQTIHTKPKFYGEFNSSEEASNKMSDSLEKWGCGYAYVKISKRKNKDNLNKTTLKKIEAIEQKLLKLKDNLKMAAGSLDSLRIDGAGELSLPNSEFVKCKDCSSKINLKSYIKSDFNEFSERVKSFVKHHKRPCPEAYCPVCGNKFFLWKVNNSSSLKKKIEKTEDEILKINGECKLLLLQKDEILTKDGEFDFMTVIGAVASC